MQLVFSITLLDQVVEMDLMIKVLLTIATCLVQPITADDAGGSPIVQFQQDGSFSNETYMVSRKEFSHDLTKFSICLWYDWNTYCTYS